MHDTTPRPGRRRVLTAMLAAAPVAGLAAAGTASAAPRSGRDDARFGELERSAGARLGVSATNVRTGAALDHRVDERFAGCSTLKTYAAAALLRRSPLSTGYFRKVVRYGRVDLVEHSPVTETRVDSGMSVAELCRASLTQSDNTAANLLLAELGGPSTITEFAREIGDAATRQDRWETELNETRPGDPRDTTTPEGIAAGYRAALLGDALGSAERRLLCSWLLGNRTGDQHIRAGLPVDWTIGDKTGGGAYGTINDVAVTWTSAGDPVVLAVLSDTGNAEQQGDPGLLAAAARIVADQLGDTSGADGN